MIIGSPIKHDAHMHMLAQVADSVGSGIIVSVSRFLQIVGLRRTVCFPCIGHSTLPQTALEDKRKIDNHRRAHHHIYAVSTAIPIRSTEVNPLRTFIHVDRSGINWY